MFFFVLHVHLIRVLLLASWLIDALSPFLPSPVVIGLLFRAPSSSSASLFCADSFGFFSPDCDFLVVIVSVASFSFCFVRDFSFGLLFQLHLVVVYSNVVAGGQSSTAVWYSATA